EPDACIEPRKPAVRIAAKAGNNADWLLAYLDSAVPHTAPRPSSALAARYDAETAAPPQALSRGAISGTYRSDTRNVFDLVQTSSLLCGWVEQRGYLRARQPAMRNATGKRPSTMAFRCGRTHHRRT